MGMARYLQAWRFIWLFVGLSLSLDQAGCGGSPSRPASGPPPVTLHARVEHVFIVMEENHSYSSVIGSADMPYLNGLAAADAYAKNYYADTHPSIGNYFMLTAGKVITNDDGFSGTVTDDNVVRHLIKAGKTWKEYSEDLPAPGYTGGDTGGYSQHHNPLSYFSDVQNDSAQAQNLVPFSQFSTDLQNHALPNYAFIVPNDADNAHDGTLADADRWLRNNIDPLIHSSDFNTPGGGLLVVTFDESAGSDTANGGGHVTWVLVGPDVKKGYVSTTFYQHESTLRLMSKLIGLVDFPGAAASAPDRGEFLSGD
jgi:phosphatidylinositol-3-phosphatase